MIPLALPALAPSILRGLLVAAALTLMVAVVTYCYNGVYDRGQEAGVAKQMNIQLSEALKQQKAMNEAQRRYDQLAASIPGQIKAAVDSVPAKVQVVREAAKHDATYRSYRRPDVVSRLRAQQLDEIRSAGGSR